ncbi:MAG: GyrI-like domain-containing protein [Terracidiphilus sp.]|jgi:predicted transcriptional regulator YdeE
MTLKIRLLFALIACLAGQAIPQSKEKALKPAHEDSFYVAGYQVRTNNANEMSGHGEIGNLWQRFMEQNLGAQIPNRADAAIIVVYSNYASNEKGEYSYLVGARVTSIEHLPTGMSYIKVVAGPYAVLTTEQGPVVEVLQAEWRKIWSMQPTDLGGRRAFLTDYEVYDQRTSNPQQAQVEIHIGLVPESH